MAAAAGVAMAMTLPATAWINGTMPGVRITISPPMMLPVAPSGPPDAPLTRAASEASAPAMEAATPTAEPAASAAPTPAIAIVQAPGLSPDPQPTMGVASGDPASVIEQFYGDVTAHQFASAASLWSPALLAQFPPAVYIDQRFALTQRIGIVRERMVTEDAASAVFSVAIAELAAGQNRQWVGTWQLIATPHGWLLNSSDLRAY